ncbi:MAG: hypothetical protein IPM59_11530 [Chloracidobacterium sp.]|nr:hypothetical protein [Chloracidobacterium sp.]
MNRIFRLLLPLCAVLLLAVSLHAQDKGSRSKKAERNTGQNAVVIIVKSAAKATWVTTKFVAKNVAKPVLKAVLLKAAPKVLIFTLKNAPVVAKHALPWALKLALL